MGFTLAACADKYWCCAAHILRTGCWNSLCRCHGLLVAVHLQAALCICRSPSYSPSGGDGDEEKEEEKKPSPKYSP